MESFDNQNAKNTGNDNRLLLATEATELLAVGLVMGH